MSDRAWIKVGRFEMFHIVREHRLSISEYVVIDALVRLADWRTAEWSGTYTELANELPVPRGAVSDAITRLAALGLVRVLAPFGKNRTGTVLVLAYQYLRLASSAADRALDARLSYAQISANDDDQYASDTRAIREPYAPISANAPALTRGDAAARGSEGARVRGLAPRTRTGDDDGIGEPDPEDVFEDDPETEPCHVCARPATCAVEGVSLCDECAPFERGELLAAVVRLDPRRHTR